MKFHEYEITRNTFIWVIKKVAFFILISVEAFWLRNLHWFYDDAIMIRANMTECRKARNRRALFIMPHLSANFI